MSSTISSCVHSSILVPEPWGLLDVIYDSSHITIIKRHLLDHLNHRVRRLFPLLVTQLDKNQLKPHSLLLQARLEVINEILKEM